MHSDIDFLLKNLVSVGAITRTQERRLREAFKRRCEQQERILQEIEEEVFGDDMRWGCD